MSRICLDTTALSDAVRNEPSVGRRLAELERGGATLVTTTINVFEASVGALRIPSAESRNRVLVRMRRLLDGVEVVGLDFDAALDSAKWMVTLLERGRPAPALDLLAAIAARRAGCSAILTRNERQFARIGALEVLSY
jgi:predicted nucleic acid-binding protein